MNTTSPGSSRVDGQTHAGSGRANGSSRVNDKATQFEVTLKVTAPTEQLVTDYCITHLRDRGYSVTRPRATLETVSQFIARLGICYETLHRSLKRTGCPNVEINRGDSGRITSILSNAEFDQFCLRNKSSNG